MSRVLKACRCFLAPVKGTWYGCSLRMDQTRVTILATAIAVVAAASALGYWLGGRLEETSPTPSPSREEREEDLRPTGVVFRAPPPGTRPAPSPSPSPTSAPAPEPPVRLTLGAAPAAVRSGAPLRVQWTVLGPKGTRGTSTRAVAALDGLSRTVGPAAEDFSLPAAFEATIVPTGTVVLTLSVETIVRGQILRAAHRMEVLDN